MERKAIAPKPLFVVGNPVPAKVYRAKFRPFAATKFIDAKALKSTAKVMIECGTLEVAGKSVILSADVRNGIIKAIRPRNCEGCSPKKGQKAIEKSTLKALLQTIEIKLTKGKTRQPEWPIGMPASASMLFRIPFGPIVIVIGDDPEHEIYNDICIVIPSETGFCAYCLFGGSSCINSGGPE